jgi:antitoxin component YwqK of YwqJK toxin-antitoxin module
MKALMAALLLVTTLPSSASPILEERRTFYPSGQPYEVRHFLAGREEGLQQAWTEDGQLYVNYEMRNGRRFGFINARPCAPVKEQP